ncbi:MAG: patatin-like phospholipase family protein [Candidatus Omnitrophica bacterium]|nr:patatin-like phospholipase family protein [Candidatus Omnitrophota bacterium]
MAFFFFQKKIESSKEYSLEDIPVFSSLTPAEQQLIEKKARLVEYKRGDIVYEEGTPSEAFYVVISGRFRLFTKSRADGEEETLMYFYRGDHFGEASLLTNQSHSASVEARRDGVILKLPKEEFLKFVNEIPAISLHLNRSLGHRLTKSEGIRSHREVKVAAFMTKKSVADEIPFYLNFSAQLEKESKRKVILVDFVYPSDAVFQSELGSKSEKYFDLAKEEANLGTDLKLYLVEHQTGYVYMSVKFDDSSGEVDRKIGAFVTLLSYRYDYILLRLPNVINPSAYKLLKHSDLVYFIVSNTFEDLSDGGKLVQELSRGFGFSKSEIRILVPENQSGDMIPYEEKEKILGMRVFSQLPSMTERPERYHATMRYLARELAGRLLGLVLGSGAAYGLAHIGVLRVLEKEGIKPDIIAGSSIGALVGGLWAKGYSADQIEEIAKEIDMKHGFFRLLGLRDLSLPHHGFFKGRQVSRWLQKFLGGQTFQDLNIPLKIVGCDLFSSEEVVLETGSVVDAIRASISIPGIFRPVPYQETLLIDGGVIDPLPVGILSEMGVKKIIAVNVLMGPDDRIACNRLRNRRRKRKMAALSNKNVIWKSMISGVDKIRGRYAGNIFNVIMSTIQFMEYEMATYWGNQADILIHPVVHEGHWAEFYSPDKFIRMGEEKTMEQIDEIRRLLIE